MKTLMNVRTLFLFISLFFLIACNKKDCTETSGSNCICTMEYNPVCGCNDKTYGNACDAECHGIDEYTQGECK